ncbi:hypothetical protein ABEB36_014357 [Hypothenemus hampei]|uniref:Uncharacterized protein n=1 Tax=Hypothenemus hampei TaxID=57062 RepID=A0ABD1E468_HYPHA
MTDEGCSSSSLENIPDTSIHSNKSKEQLTHAFEHCRNLLVENNLIVRNSASSIPSESRIIGEEMYTRIVEMLGENVLIDEEELIFHNEQYEEDSQLEIEDNKSDASTSTSGSGSGNASDVCSEKKMKFTQYIPLAAKIKTVRAAQLYPKWSLKTLQVKGSQRLKSKDDLKRWEQDVLNRGTIIDKFAAIDSWTHDRFIEAKEQHLQVLYNIYKQTHTSVCICVYILFKINIDFIS